MAGAGKPAPRNRMDDEIEYELPEWGANLHNWPTKRLESLLTRYERQLTHKLAVADKHATGTSYHTRADNEAGMYRERITKIRSILDNR